jgi:hypothetical protein
VSPVGSAPADAQYVLLTTTEGTRAVRRAVARRYGLLGRVAVGSSRVFRGDRGSTGSAVAGRE